MLAKRTVKNQLTLPKKVADQFPDIEYFDVRAGEGQIILLPVRTNQLDQLRHKMKKLGVNQGDIRNAVKWARTHHA